MLRVMGPLTCALLGAALLGAAEREHGNVVAADGVRIAWEARGTGTPVVVMVHCWACDRQFFEPQAAALASDHRVVTLDLPGHGKSGAGRARWSVTGLGADVAHVVKKLKLDRVVLVGHSMGGPTALAAANLLGERVAGVVLVDTVHDAETKIPGEALERYAATFEADYEGTMRGMIRALFAGQADPALPEWVLERALLADRKATVALLRSFKDVDNSKLLAGAGVPVRAINAAPLPPAIPETKTEANRRYADFDAVLIEGVGHYLQLEKPAEFNAALRNVLAQIARAGQQHPLR